LNTNSRSKGLVRGCVERARPAVGGAWEGEKGYWYGGCSLGCETAWLTQCSFSLVDVWLWLSMIMMMAWELSVVPLHHQKAGGGRPICNPCLPSPTVHSSWLGAHQQPRAASSRVACNAPHACVRAPRQDFHHGLRVAQGVPASGRPGKGLMTKLCCCCCAPRAPARPAPLSSARYRRRRRRCCCCCCCPWRQLSLATRGRQRSRCDAAPPRGCPLGGRCARAVGWTVRVGLNNEGGGRRKAPVA
jgi:hypothetical protein